MSVSLGHFLQPRMIMAPLIMLYVRMWDLEDEEVVFNIRCLYGFSQSLVFGALLYIRYRDAARPLLRPRVCVIFVLQPYVKLLVCIHPSIFGCVCVRFKIWQESNQKVVRVVKPGSPSLMDPTEKVETTVESMTIEQYEAELLRKEVQQVRILL